MNIREMNMAQVGHVGMKKCSTAYLQLCTVKSTIGSTPNYATKINHIITTDISTTH